MNRILAIILVSFSIHSNSSAQSASDINKAREEGMRAVRMIAAGRTDDAILLLRYCIKLDPVSIVYPFEIGFAYFLEKRYGKAISQLEQLRFHKQVHDRVYLLLAKSYLKENNEEKFKLMLDKGIQLFPSSGKLYNEKGIYALSNEDTTGATLLFQQAVAAEPSFPSAYYNLCLLFATKGEWQKAKLAGETFLNIERSNSTDTKLISKTLYLIFDNEAKQQPIDSSCHEKLQSMASAKWIARLDTVVQQTIILQSEYNNGTAFAKSPLVAFKAKMKQEGMLEAYYYWLFRLSAQADYINWRNSNTETATAFDRWFRRNGIHAFFRK